VLARILFRRASFPGTPYEAANDATVYQFHWRAVCVFRRSSRTSLRLGPLKAREEQSKAVIAAPTLACGLPFSPGKPGYEARWLCQP
jgi:hypothetical protein